MEFTATFPGHWLAQGQHLLGDYQKVDEPKQGSEDEGKDNSAGEVLVLKLVVL